MSNFLKLWILYLSSFAVMGGSLTLLENVRIVTEDYPPYNYLVNSELRGEGTEIVRALQSELGISGIEHEVLNWTISYNLALEKPFVLLYSISRTIEREELFHWIGPIARGVPYFYSLAKTKGITESNIKDYDVCSVRDDYKSNYLKRNHYKLTYVKKFSQCLKMLMRNRSTLILSSPNSLVYEIKRQGIERETFKRLHSVPEISKGIYLALSKSTPTFAVDAFNKGFSRLLKKGVLKKIQHRYQKLSPKK